MPFQDITKIFHMAPPFSLFFLESPPPLKPFFSHAPPPPPSLVKNERSLTVANLQEEKKKLYLTGSVSGILTIFGQNNATIPYHIYKIILKHQDKEINQSVKGKQIMVCYSPLWK